MSFLRLRISAAGSTLAVTISAGLLPAGTAHAAPSTETSVSTVRPFVEPGFTAVCTWHEFGEGEKPPWWLLFADPLCVEYSKRDITVDDGGALRFLIAEPTVSPSPC